MVVRADLCSLAAWKLPLPLGSIEIRYHNIPRGRLAPGGGGECQFGHAVDFSVGLSTPPSGAAVAAHRIDSSSHSCSVSFG